MTVNGGCECIWHSYVVIQRIGSNIKYWSKIHVFCFKNRGQAPKWTVDPCKHIFDSILSLPEMQNKGTCDLFCHGYAMYALPFLKPFSVGWRASRMRQLDAVYRGPQSSSRPVRLVPVPRDGVRVGESHPNDIREPIYRLSIPTARPRINLLFPLHQGNGVFHGTPVCPVQFVSVKHQSGSELLLGNSGNRKPR